MFAAKITRNIQLNNIFAEYSQPNSQNIKNKANEKQMNAEIH